MRFLVDLYRWLILLTLAVALVGGVFFGAVLTVGPMATDPQRMIYIAVLIGAAVTVILSLGMTATFISIHDRLGDIADALSRRTIRDERGEL